MLKISLGLFAIAAVMLAVGFGSDAGKANAQEETITICKVEAGGEGIYAGDIGDTREVPAYQADGDGDADFLQNGWALDCLGSITIVLDTEPEDTAETEFDFDGSFDFELEDDEQITFPELDPGVFEVHQNETAGYTISDIYCDGGDVIIDDDDASVSIDLGGGEDVTCTFVNEALTVPTATPAPTESPEPTATTVVTLKDCVGSALVTTVNGVITEIEEGAAECEVAPVPTSTRAPSGNTIIPPSTGSAGLR